MMAILTSVSRYLIVILIWISLIISSVEHLLMLLLVVCLSSLEKCLFRSSTHFLKFYLFFNWRIIALQNFVVFCQTSICTHFLIGLFGILCYWVVWTVCMFWKLSPCHLGNLQIFSPGSFCCCRSIAKQRLTLCFLIDCRCQPSLSFTISWSLLKLMSIKLMMLSDHLILCCPCLLLPSIFPIIIVFSNELTLCIRCKALELQLQHQSFQWIFRTDFL